MPLLNGINIYVQRHIAERSDKFLQIEELYQKYVN